MNRLKNSVLRAAVSLALLGGSGTANAVVNVQCPGDKDGDATWNAPNEKAPGQPGGPPANTRCKHLVAGDGFVVMSDGNPMYTFGFGHQTGTPRVDVIGEGILDAEWPGPVIELEEGDEFHLSLTNVGTVIRPDLFDPHTVHFHGFPNAASVFDGVPEVSISINMGSTLTYYYNIVQPGTFIYHCHVEATEHMEMGMLGNLYVMPAQDGNTALYPSGKYVYNDGDGSTGYDVGYPLQLTSMDPVFHDASLSINPLPFKNMKDTYAMINGRGYPDTVNTDPAGLPAPPEKVEFGNSESSQLTHALITATQGKRVLLRLSNLSVTNYYTVTAQGLPMKVVGQGARELRGPGGKVLHYDTASVTLGGGESAEVLIDTSQVEPGTYFLYTTNLNYLSNNDQDNGGMMTEIVIAAP